MSTIPILFREFIDGDRNFIMNHWLNETIRLHPFRYMHYKTFNKKFSESLNILLSNNNVKIMLAVNPDESDHIFSFIVYEKVSDITIIHFVYTKDVYRGQNIASDLLFCVFPDFGNKECIISQLPNLDDQTYNKYRDLNIKQLKDDNLDIKFQNPLRHYLMKNKLFYDAFLFGKRTIK